MSERQATVNIRMRRDDRDLAWLLIAFAETKVGIERDALLEQAGAVAKRIDHPEDAAVALAGIAEAAPEPLRAQLADQALETLNLIPPRHRHLWSISRVSNIVSPEQRIRLFEEMYDSAWGLATDREFSTNLPFFLKTGIRDSFLNLLIGRIEEMGDADLRCKAQLRLLCDGAVAPWDEKLEFLRAAVAEIEHNDERIECIGQLARFQTTEERSATIRMVIGDLMQLASPVRGAIAFIRGLGTSFPEEALSNFTSLAEPPYDHDKGELLTWLASVSDGRVRSELARRAAAAFPSDVRRLSDISELLL